MNVIRLLKLPCVSGESSTIDKHLLSYIDHLKDIMGFDCPYCGDPFTRREHMERHIRSHTQERPFICSICSKTFARKDLLTRHSKNHTKSKSNNSCPTSSLEPRCKAACKNCAKLKQRCTHSQSELQCDNCIKKNIECIINRKHSRNLPISNINPNLNYGPSMINNTIPFPQFLSSDLDYTYTSTYNPQSLNVNIDPTLNGLSSNYNDQLDNSFRRGVDMDVMKRTGITSREFEKYSIYN